MWLSIGILAFLLILNGVLASSELAFMTSRAARLQRLADRGNKGAKRAIVLAREPTRFLSTVQVGITLIGIFAGALGERQLSAAFTVAIAKIPPLEPYADPIALVVVVLVITYFSLVIGELVPKKIALAHPEWVASTIAAPLSVLSVMTAWPVKVLSASTELILRILRIKPHGTDDVSEDDVRSLVSRAATTGVFSPQEHALFQRAMRVGDLIVRDLMVPRSEIVWVPEDATSGELHVLLGTSPFSHFPVCRGSIDELTGVVHIKDLIAYGLLAEKPFNIAAVAQKPLFVPETMPALKLLDTLKSSRTHVAFIVNEYGGTEGLITLNDLVEALVGDVSRRGEPTPPKVIRRSDGSLLIDARLPLHEMVVVLGAPPEVEEELPDVSTVAGLVIALLGRIPKEAEFALWHGWRLEVVDMDGMRVDQILAMRIEPAANPEGE
jgi:putative hemolysin